LSKDVFSLRQHDLDQVIRVERGSLLSVPHRGTPRSIVGNKYTRISWNVNSKTMRVRQPPPGASQAAGPYMISARGGATLLSSVVHAG
jgi:hypothetical protein